MKIKFLSLVALSTALLYSCGGETADNEVTDETANTEATEASTEAVAYSINTDVSVIEWLGKKEIGDSHNGTIEIESGSFMIKDGKVTGGEFTVDMTSMVDLDLEDPEYNQKLIGHLMSPDFFSVDSFPTASFLITSVSDTSVTGDLTIKGITKKYDIPYTLTEEEGTAMVEGAFSFDRAKYNVRYGSSSFFEGLGDKVIADLIDLKIKAVASPAAEEAEAVVEEETTEE